MPTLRLPAFDSPQARRLGWFSTISALVLVVWSSLRLLGVLDARTSAWGTIALGAVVMTTSALMLVITARSVRARRAAFDAQAKALREQQTGEQA